MDNNDNVLQDRKPEPEPSEVQPDLGHSEVAGNETKAPALIQFDWKTNWDEKVVPLLDSPPVRIALEIGMKMLDPTWVEGDAPYLLGKIGGPLEDEEVVPGTLPWYQPFGGCHGIAFFAFTMGKIIYPHLDWRFVSGDLHTVAVGYDQDGQPRVVMDILMFDSMTAEKSIAFAQQRGQNIPPSGDWDLIFEYFSKSMDRYLRTGEWSLPQECLNESEQPDVSDSLGV
jgi:hypothetical protein